MTVAAAAPTGRGSLRVESLDGLRGVAAFAVLIGHMLLASNGTQDRYFAYPLDGSEAVIVFFVLSGFVLALPASRGQPFSPAYYPRRFVRLYFPVWGALAFAALMHVIVTRHGIPGESWWVNAQAVDMDWDSAVSNTTLAVKAGGMEFNPALWSLRWEVVFSALLPLFLLLAALTRRSALAAIAAALACLLITRSSGSGFVPAPLKQAAEYLPIFLLGCVMAFHSHRLLGLRAALASTNQSGSTVVKVAAAIGCLACLSSDWWLEGKAVNPGVVPALESAGAALAVGLAIVLPGLDRRLTTPRAQWLGKRSFSLYLIHAPLVVTLAFATHGRLSPPLFFLIALPASLLAAEGFFRLVEGPSHRLSRALGRKIAFAASFHGYGGNRVPES